MPTQPTNLYEYYKAQNKPLPTWQEHAPIYEQAGLGKASDFVGSAEQNTRLLAYFQKPPASTANNRIEAMAQNYDQTTNATGVKAPEGQEYGPDGQLRPKGAPVVTSKPARYASIDDARKEIEKGLTPPNPYKGVAEFDRLRTEKGIVQDEDELLAIQNEARMAKEEMRQFKAGASEGVSMGGYLGNVSEAERNVNFRVEGLALREQAVATRLNTKNAYIGTVLKLGQEDYNEAKQQYDDAYNRNVKAIELYNEGLDNQQKDALSGLTTITNLFKDKNMDFSTMSPALKAQIQTLELQAGLPAGTFEAAYSASEDEKILAPIINTDADGNKSVYFFTQGKDGVPHLKNMTNIGGGGTSTTSQFYADQVLAGTLALVDVPSASRDGVVRILSQGVSGKEFTDEEIRTLVNEDKASNATYEQVIQGIEASAEIANKDRAKLIAGELYGVEQKDTDLENRIAQMKKGGILTDQDIRSSLRKQGYSDEQISNSSLGGAGAFVESIINYLFN